METKLQLNAKKYQLERYPKTDDKSLRAWSNAELLTLDYITDLEVQNIHIYNDRFGIFNTLLNTKKLTTVWAYASQKKAITQNLKLNHLPTDIVYKTPLDTLEKVDLALIKLPKSVELFELFLQQIYKSADENTVVVCGFMTKYFSRAYLKKAERYFEEVEQTNAWKKARLLVLKTPKKEVEERALLNEIKFKEQIIKQYYGVFSSDKIDYGTQFFLDNLKVQENELKVLDVASGNGVIAWDVLQQNPEAKVTLVDDFNVAIASSKLNITAENAEFICADTLNDLEKDTFDLVVSNPPFHFEHENNIEVTIELFKGVARCLKPSGRFVLVANTHLNYKTHLEKVFTNIKIIGNTNKFHIIECKND
ncbi:class I SAM-dependent methyltransferase [Tenacibaculum finnmarkense]|uniref:class I SAM-dependent methyltransferase n=1 Tax=Tenacibaculum finnmarkense TaxID=2781243 RepID=UPI001E390F62|nr:methyltransferase [Tenacibaculum finnmarkense]MCD8399586.1 methyltransferase [Tenacibaculum finnmarkense genomovar ulcerans]MCG8762745.1 class I SAM-dependent methyltransferase [Tenacibaculum finnmarkense]MCG8771011.1 class I SAM-dependent methyltransferase [Tenacibaculum finnmarkense]MCG8787933.1 class I SAM-dependent methyltransferase [Tenacibaculum finnmarkense]MCG8873134.1 class I SAM-dependent methyltransferase [Tenacibaculum finnmarkense]